MKRPEVCVYCDGHGNGTAGPCGFCDEGRPLDTQEDWDRTWGSLFDRLHEAQSEDRQKDA